MSDLEQGDSDRSDRSSMYDEEGRRYDDDEDDYGRGRYDRRYDDEEEQDEEEEEEEEQEEEEEDEENENSQDYGENNSDAYPYRVVNIGYQGTYTDSQNRRSAKPTPTVTAYRSLHELAELREQFYSSNKTHWRQAVARVQILQLRGKIPHGVECTALFVSIFLSEDAHGDLYLVRTAYAMALVRFVNGVLDPLQQGRYAKALTQLAKTVALPASLVEIRHAATHEELPSLGALRLQAQKACEWLLANFWNELPDELDGNWPQVNHAPQLSMEAKVKRMLLIYKRFSKLALENDILADPEINKYHLSIRFLQECVETDNAYFIVVNRLVTGDFLIRKQDKIKMKTALRIYLPLLDKLGARFRLGVIMALIQNSSSYSPAQYDADCQLQALEWLQYLVPRALDEPARLTYFHASIYDSLYLNVLFQNNLSLLDPKSPVRVLVEALLSGESQPKKFSMPPLLDAILGEKENASESERKRKKPLSVFSEHEAWEVRPFGVA